MPQAPVKERALEAPSAEMRTETRITIHEIEERCTAVRELMERSMKKGVHYGNIPGTKGNSLLQVGADKIGMMFRLNPDFSVESATRKDDLIAYAVRCTLRHIQTGEVWATGMGSANTREARHAGAVKKRGAWDLDNTILKMACKRAKISAIKAATGAGELFVNEEDDDAFPEVDGEERTR